MLFIISLISFIAINLAPNSFFASGELNPNITQESIEHLKAIYGLDKPLYVQYFSWIWAMLHLDFGISFASGQMVKTEILNRIPITLTINIISMVLVFVLSLYLGIKSALNKNQWFDKFASQLSLLSFSMPSFYLALLLVLIFFYSFRVVAHCRTTLHFQCNRLRVLFGCSVAFDFTYWYYYIWGHWKLNFIYSFPYD